MRGPGEHSLRRLARGLTTAGGAALPFVAACGVAPPLPAPAAEARACRSSVRPARRGAGGWTEFGRVTLVNSLGNMIEAYPPRGQGILERIIQDRRPGRQRPPGRYWAADVPVERRGLCP